MAKKPTPAQVEAALGRFRAKLKHAFGAVERHEKRLRAEKKRTEKKPHPVTMIGIAAPTEKSKVISRRKSKATKAAMPAKDRSQSEKLYFYEVDEYGTITQSNFSEPKINRHIFDNISEDSLTTPEDIIYEVEYYNAAVSYLRSLACDEHEALIRRIQRQDYRDDKELQRMTRLAKALEDEDDGWKEWIKFEGDEGASRFEKVIVDWLAAPVEWQEDMPWNATAQGCAMHFFEGQDSATLDALGVGIVEGECPGSTYYAATLEKSVEEANDIAKKLGLEYRFRKEDKDKS